MRCRVLAFAFAIDDPVVVQTSSRRSPLIDDFGDQAACWFWSLFSFFAASKIREISSISLCIWFSFLTLRVTLVALPPENDRNRLKVSPSSAVRILPAR